MIDNTCNACWGSGWETQFVTPCRECNGKGTITPPEKPENRDQVCKECTTYFGYQMSKCFHCTKVVEPSESQEETQDHLWKEVTIYIDQSTLNLTRSQIITSLSNKFTIIRK